VGRSAYRTKHGHREMLTKDELEAVVQRAAAGQEPESER
jgi:multicomponent Na+:H+ antiporter subunit G